MSESGIREALTLDDVLLVPGESSVLPAEVATRTNRSTMPAGTGSRSRLCAVRRRYRKRGSSGRAASATSISAMASGQRRSCNATMARR